MGEPQRDFLALSHGEEWVNFYESFDKLVQDNLARSSDLLKRAMTLPEVADREVAKIKDEHQTKLSEERAQQHAVLSELRDEVTNSQNQISILARSLGAVVGDLERLSGRITSALAAVDPAAARPSETASTARPQTSPLTAVAPASKPQTGPLSGLNESPTERVAEVDPAIDLNALAEAETDKPAQPSSAQELVGATNGTGERQRPAWLSVTRPIATDKN